MLAAEEIPKITDWMQAWGSLAGLLMSTIAVVFTGLLLRHEIRVRRDEQRDNEAALARLVVAEFRFANGPKVNHEGVLTGQLTYVEYRIRNLSSSPILNVSFAVMNGTDGKVYSSPEQKSVVVSEADMGVPFKPPLHPEQPGGPHHLMSIIRFTDANGLQWIREGTTSPVRFVTRRKRHLLFFRD
ncbi:hypothetical protein [Micromonospora costi]|uniref:Uncharacterized protein n=1 Tax=Micromonospora costi TaxID=1530042 RepID=A0A3B0A5F9_9ACTN|nr:hypothetical protein [Micromonospora costi]RKN55998.1 hypothetical protein D7193_15550 [Micromonospora costi]